MTRPARSREWWTPQDRERFNALTAQLVAQYDAYEPLPGHHVQGALTLGENIADLAGLTVAYDAYRHALGGRPAPVIDGLTGDQRFYLGWAQVWRRKYREANLLQRLLTDPHSPVRAARRRRPQPRSLVPGLPVRARPTRSILAPDAAGPHLVGWRARPTSRGGGGGRIGRSAAPVRRSPRSPRPPCCSGRRATRSSPAPSSPG